VIGYGAGGLCDSVRCLSETGDHPTGLLFPEQSVASLAAALERFESAALWRRLPAEAQRQWAEGFAPEHFRRRMGELLDNLWQRHRQRLLRQSRPLAQPLPTPVPLA
jgi:hypothetical protein